MVVHHMAQNNIHPEVARLRTGHSSLGALNAYTRYNEETSAHTVSKLLIQNVAQDSSTTTCTGLTLYFLILAVLGLICLAIVGYFFFCV